jgi:hypothetical protein
MEIFTLIATLIGALSPVIVALIQANREKQKPTSGILLPSNVVMHSPKKQSRLIIILSFAFAGGFVGFLGGRFLSNNVPSNTAPTSVIIPTQIIPTVYPTNSATPSPTDTQQPMPTETPSAFTKFVAEQIVLREDCGYNANYAIAQDGAGSVTTFDLENYPSGYIIGDAVIAEIDGHSLGTAGVTFIIELSTTQERRYLKIKDGMFFIVAPENAEGWLRLRQLHLECKGKYREPVYFP